MAHSAALDRNCAGMFVRCTSSTRSCSERWLSSRVVAALLAIVPLLLLEPTRRPLLSTTAYSAHIAAEFEKMRNLAAENGS